MLRDILHAENKLLAKLLKRANTVAGCNKVRFRSEQSPNGRSPHPSHPTRSRPLLKLTDTSLDAATLQAFRVSLLNLS